MVFLKQYLHYYVLLVVDIILYIRFYGNLSVLDFFVVFEISLLVRMTCFVQKKNWHIVTPARELT